MIQSHTRENGEINCSTAAGNGNAIELTVNANFEDEVKQRAELVEWLNDMFPDLRLPSEASEEEIRLCLIDGTVLCSVLDRLSPGSINEWAGSDPSSEPHLENVKRFLEAMDQLGLPMFRLLDLQQGSMVTVVEYLLTLKECFNSNFGGDNIHITSSMSKSGTQPRKRWKVLEVESSEGINGTLGEVSLQNIPVAGEERHKSLSDSKFQRVLRSPVISEPSAALRHHVGHKFHEVFQLKQGRYADLPAAKISEMMNSSSLENAPTQSLLTVVNGILDESIERKNGEIPHRVACLLRKVIQEIERRISTQAEHLRTQNTLYKAREDKYQSRIRVLETLATGNSEETQVAMNKFQQIKMEKTKMEEKKKIEELDMVKLVKEKDHSDLEISTLKQELELVKQKYEQHCLQLETQAKGTKFELEERLKELEGLLEDSTKKAEELEAFSKSKAQSWNEKEHSYQTFIDFQFKSLRELRVTSQSIKKVVLNTQRVYSEEFSRLGVKLKGLAEAAENYHMVLAENRKLYNEVQDLKGNIRVYCRIRPFLPGQNGKQTTIDFIGENGELVIANPLKQGKDGHRLFKFNKVFAPTATQEEVFLDTQPLIRSILDGYNVCIFAYGQTGSGKTYTMTGPDAASKEDWGVNYRALNDLFHISQSRRNSFIYEVGVQMVEIYNEQVRDLLASDGTQKKLGIWSTTQPNGLAVPDATMLPVKSTGDVLDLMQIGLMNRAVGATALNERSSRSHSVLTVHVRGTDLATSATLRGNLHLVDLAGSERVDRSEATGERLREAQHINKSLSALGDVIFALAQKSPHVPYRNSKLTQVLQSSLGGQAKTLMFVQLNPDVDSYFETLSTLKFAERVSGVELGAARSSKESRDVRELMEQVASLKDTIAKKDEELERLQLLKDLRTVSPTVNGEKRGTSLLRHGPSSPSRHSLSVAAAQRIRRLSGGKGSGLEKAASDQDNSSEHSDKRSEAGSQQSMDDLRHHKEFFQESKLAIVDAGQNFSSDVELLGFGDADSEERLSDISDGGLSMGTETDGSIASVVEFTLFPEGAKPAVGIEKSKPAPSKLPKPPPKQVQTGSVRRSSSKETLKVLTSSKKVPTSGSSSTTKPVKRWQ
ncbi:kinesin-like protein KIN-14J [Telopea speciosissima]|uniref:kinesin-like protein KIN-14J n=1 Tax=Telopea speciosissima TaxID=54955 RepID=UPI001CC6E434|nr:kinesin-like protein KIN-14J [Telopea speciosissima]XP_043724727.1 kinesin-like protein KIN-14J [Telopea speciosissima]